MKINQISVFVENRKGRLFDICSLLSTNRINIRALTVAESQDFGVVRMVVDRPQEALALLKANRFVANFSEIVAVEVADKPGSLAAILKALNEKKINVEYMYGFMEKCAAKALMVFRFDNPDKAIECLSKAKIKIVRNDKIVKG